MIAYLRIKIVSPLLVDDHGRANPFVCKSLDNIRNGGIIRRDLNLLVRVSAIQHPIIFLAPIKPIKSQYKSISWKLEVKSIVIIRCQRGQRLMQLSNGMYELLK